MLAKLRRNLSERGVAWTGRWVLRSLGLRIAAAMEDGMVALEQRRFLIGDGVVSSQRHTAADNRRWWNAYDWRGGGEEWSAEVRRLRGLDPEAWKTRVVRELIEPFVATSTTALEIGPGAGRWSEILAARTAKLVLADVAETCLAICRERLAGRTNVEFHAIVDGRFPFLPDASVDLVWSYDAFVHINPTETDAYLAEIRRVLRSGGVGVVHHSGEYESRLEARKALRSATTGPFFAHLVARNGLRLERQDRETPHFPGDVVSIFRRP